MDGRKLRYLAVTDLSDFFPFMTKLIKRAQAKLQKVDHYQKKSYLAHNI